MSEDISVLGIAVETKGVKEGSDALDKLNKAGADAEKSTVRLTDATKQASSVMADLAVVAKTAAGAFGIYKMADYAMDAALLSARYETLGVAMTVVGKNAGYSAGNIEATAAALQKSGISMLESRQQVTKLVQAHIDLADSTKLARVAQDAAVIGGVNSSEAFSRMVAGITTGQSEILRGIGLNVSMNQAYETMAATLGKNADALTQNEKIQAVVNETLRQGVGIAGAYESTMTTAGKQISSMTRYTADLKLKIGDVFNESLTVGVMALTEGLKDANGEMNAMAANGQIAKFTSDLSDTIAFLADSAASLAATFRIVGTAAAEAAAKVNLLLTPMAGANEPIDFSKFGEKWGAITSAAGEDYQKALASASMFRDALKERRAAVAADDAKAKSDSLAKEASYFAAVQEVQSKFSKSSLAVQQSEMLKVADKFYGDNHKYEDTTVTPKKKSDSSAASEAKSTLSLDLDKIKKAADEEIAIYSDSDKIMSALRSASMVNDTTYYEWKSDNIKKLAEAEEGALQKQIARISQEQLTGKASIENAKAILDAESKLQKVRSDANTAITVNGLQASAAVNNIAKAYANATAAADEYLASVKRQNARELSGIGAGVSFRKEQSDKNKIEDKYLTKKATLDTFIRENPGNAEKQKQYDNELALAQKTYNEEIRLYADSRSAIMAAQESWLNGMTEAMANYAEESRNVSAQYEKTFTSAFKGIEDALVSFVSTGKLSFSSLTTSIIADLARIQIKAALAPVTSSLGGMLTNFFTPSNANTTIPMQAGGGYHTGGIVGSEPTFSRNVDMSIFHGASKYHTGGIVDGEVPIIAKRGEGVFTPGQMKAMGGGSSNVSVVVNNTASDKVESTVKPKMNNGKLELEVLIQQVMANDMRQNGRITQGLAGTFGLARAS